MPTTKRLTLAFAALFLFAVTAQAAEPIAPLKLSDHKPPIRLACLGDSITHGVGAEAGWSWPEQLDRMLGSEWDVRNYGHSGASIAKEEKHTIWNQKEYQNALLFHPDVVIILLGTNDTKPENWAKKDQFPKLYNELVLSFQKLSSQPRVYCGLPPYVANKGAFGINEPGIQEQIPMIQQVAAERGCGVIDVHAATAGRDEFFKDNVHPSTAGATAIAAAVYQTLTGKAWQGKVPGPQDVAKSKPMVRVVENAGELTYRETFALIVIEAGLPADKLAALRDHFDETVFAVEGTIHEMQVRIEEYDQIRMKYKHTNVEADKPLYGLYKGKVAETKKELERYKNAMNMALVASVPDDHRAGFGAGWVQKYVYDRLAPVAATLTTAQHKQIRAICQAAGPAYGRINNTPERSIESVEVYSTVYEKVLDSEQKKRVMPR